ncbi:hypothetical protein BO71DRAFT_440502 [Aspergillus ellipticus CBS 707.79]|uniref:J domain-containing protein n=1 Tax=Aspergillus ellipticus CBS 707.79 TaxID=1448320 RepID=A0A319DD12_9EURO|nr:hypothetical protein BO71DRAFT_440502 [Aspergillus ellipticus CBS 707.79]
MSLPRLKTTAATTTAHLRRSTHHQHHQHHPYTTTSTSSPRLPIHSTHTHTHSKPPNPTNPSYAHTQRTPFSTTSAARASAREPTYYELLDIPPSATPSEIKNVLSNATKRATYDHDHNIHAHGSSTHSAANPGQHPMGSHSSYGANLHTKGASYAGSRPASGLSKRRGTFRGPPPSFYANGGYGNTGRRADGGFAGGAGGGARRTVNQEEDPTAFIDRNNVLHFNARGHYRTQVREDMRREERRSRAMGSTINEQFIGTPGSYAVRVVMVCGILLGAGAMTGFLQGGLGNDKKIVLP